MPRAILGLFLCLLKLDPTCSIAEDRFAWWQASTCSSCRANDSSGDRLWESLDDRCAYKGCSIDSPPRTTHHIVLVWKNSFEKKPTKFEESIQYNSIYDVSTSLWLRCFLVAQKFSAAPAGKERRHPAAAVLPSPASCGPGTNPAPATTTVFSLDLVDVWTSFFTFGHAKVWEAIFWMGFKSGPFAFHHWYRFKRIPRWATQLLQQFGNCSEWPKHPSTLWYYYIRLSAYHSKWIALGNRPNENPSILQARRWSGSRHSSRQDCRRREWGSRRRWDARDTRDATG